MTKACLLYTSEMMDDTAEPTVNYIKMSAQGVEVRKQGQVNVHMVFEQGKKNMTFYSTPFGTDVYKRQELENYI